MGSSSRARRSACDRPRKTAASPEPSSAGHLGATERRRGVNPGPGESCALAHARRRPLLRWPTAGRGSSPPNTTRTWPARAHGRGGVPWVKLQHHRDMFERASLPAGGKGQACAGGSSLARRRFGSRCWPFRCVPVHSRRAWLSEVLSLVELSSGAGGSLIEASSFAVVSPVASRLAGAANVASGAHALSRDNPHPRCPARATIPPRTVTQPPIPLLA